MPGFQRNAHAEKYIFRESFLVGNHFQSSVLCPDYGPVFLMQISLFFFVFLAGAGGGGGRIK